MFFTPKDTIEVMVLIQVIKFKIQTNFILKSCF